MSEIVLEVKNLKKHFKRIKAVDGVSFFVKPGTCFGLLGPNGAGKSTTIECIEKITEPTEGEILFKGKKLDNHFLSKLGVQFQETALPPKLKVKEVLSFFRQLYPDSKPMEELIQLCQLEEYLEQFHDQVSGGQRQRLLLAVALCHDPELVLLDEPTTGLDPQARRNLWEVVRGIKKSGKTVILTTHYMDEAYELCDEIGIMDHGKLIAHGAPRKLLEENFKTVVIQLPKGKISEKVLKQLDVFHQVHEREDFIELHTENLNQTISELNKLDEDLTGMNIRQSNLEDLFLHLTGKELRS